MEEWIAVKGFEGLYEINKKGEVKSLQKRNANRLLSTRIDRAGYLTVRVCSEGRVYGKFVHRLLAENFLLNPDNKKFVNHINGNKLDNSLENLEWVTHSENILHAYTTGLIKKKHKTLIRPSTQEKFRCIRKAA